MSTVADLTRSKPELIAENMLLRQQLIVLERLVERPQLTQRDRQILVLLASQIQGWREAMVVVKPETLLRWHREGFRLYWRRKSRAKKGRPPTLPEVIALIEEMVINNRTWRAPRIQGELLKLGIVVHAETVKKYMRRARKGLPPRNPGQTGRRSSRIMLARPGPVTSCRRMTSSFEWCSCISLSSWAHAASCSRA